MGLQSTEHGVLYEHESFNFDGWMPWNVKWDELEMFRYALTLLLYCTQSYREQYAKY